MLATIFLLLSEEQHTLLRGGGFPGGDIGVVSKPVHDPAATSVVGRSQFVHHEHDKSETIVKVDVNAFVATDLLDEHHSSNDNSNNNASATNSSSGGGRGHSEIDAAFGDDAVVHTFVINLNSNADRHFVAEMRIREQPGFEFHHVPAVNGRKLPGGCGGPMDAKTCVHPLQKI